VRQQQPVCQEKRFVAWLDEVKGMPKLFFLVGDLFDFGSNITVVPKGFVRVLGKLAEIRTAESQSIFVEIMIYGWMIIFRKLNIQYTMTIKEYTFGKTF
jgi:UDP-2,3-diacylglucosamine hydrolase